MNREHRFSGLSQELGEAYPAPTEDQVEAVLHRITQTPRSPARIDSQRRWMMVAAALVLLAVLGASVVVDGLWFFERNPADRPAEVMAGVSRLGGCMPNSKIATMISAAGLALSLACAQEPTQLPAEPIVSVSEVDGTQLKPGTWTYEHFEVMENGYLTPPVRRTVHTLSRITYEGSPAWRSVAVRYQQNGRIQIDTAYVAMSDLRPLYQIFHGPPPEGSGPRGFVSRRFAPGQVVEKSLADYRVIDTAFASSGFDSLQLVDVEHVALLLRSIPLSRSWKRSVVFASWQGMALSVVNVWIDGEETVTVPAGTYDCWIVEFGTPMAETWWVSKDDQWVVKRRRMTFTGVVREIMLTAWEPGA